MGWWKFDEIGGSTALDWSGHGHHGTIYGDPQYVTGQLGSALELNGSSDYVDTSDPGTFDFETDFTWTAWIKATGNGTILARAPATGNWARGGKTFFLRNGQIGVDVGWVGYLTTTVFETSGDNDTTTLFVDGNPVGSKNDWNVNAESEAGLAVKIGFTNGNFPSPSWFPGRIDDVRVYNYALSQFEVQRSMDPSKAYNPKPTHQQTDVELSAKLSWSPGTDEDTGNVYTKHDVYFGTSFDDVNSATVPNMTLIGANEYTPPALNLYGRYYWRIDGVKASGEAYKGAVWTFKAIYDETLVGDPNLLAWYKFEDDATDSSGYGRDGAEVSEPAYAGGYDGQAIQLDGAGDYVSSWLPPITADATIMAWVRMARDNVDGYYGIAGKLASRGQTYHGISLVRHSSNVFRLWVGNGDTNLQDTSSDVTYTDTAWHHVAGVVEGGTNYLYVDGVLQTATSSKLISDSGQVAHIGRQYSDLDDRYFNGLIDDVRFYNRGLSAQEVRNSMRMNLAIAWYPNPRQGETGVARDVVLTWSPGDYAPVTNGHYVSFGADDPANLAPVGPQPQTPNNISVGPFDLGKTYYWSVDEANDAAPDGKDLGRIWKFTTSDFVTVEDFEFYDWDRQLGADANWVYYVWTDGLANFLYLPDMGGNETGANLFVQEGTILGGIRALRFDYDNDGFAENPRTGAQLPRLHKWSKAKADVSDLPSGIGADWVSAGAQALSLWFYGDSLNDIEPMWVELADSTGRAETVIYGGYEGEDPCHIKEASWREWNIDLQDFNDGGVDLTDVNSIAIGFGTEGDEIGGGYGFVYFDDILIHTPRCILSRRSAEFAKIDYAPENTGGDCVIDYQELEIMTRDWLEFDYEIAAVAPNSVGLVAWYEFDGDANDSSVNNLHGTEMGGPTYVAGQVDQAISLDGIDDYVDCGNNSVFNFTNGVTVAAWIKVTTFDKSWQAIVTKGDNSWRIHRSSDLNVINWATTGMSPLSINGTTNANDGEWHHVAGTYNGAERVLYVDGMPEASVATTGSIGTGAHPVYIGENAQATGRFWSGTAMVSHITRSLRPAMALCMSRWLRPLTSLMMSRSLRRLLTSRTMIFS